MKKRYWLPIAGLLLMPEGEHEWRANTGDKTTGYYVWLAAQVAECVCGLLLTLYIIALIHK